MAKQDTQETSQIICGIFLLAALDKTAILFLGTLCYKLSHLLVHNVKHYGPSKQPKFEEKV